MQISDEPVPPLFANRLRREGAAQSADDSEEFRGGITWNMAVAAAAVGPQQK